MLNLIFYFTKCQKNLRKFMSKLQFNFRYIRKLHYYDSVNYNYIIKQLQSIIITNKIIIDDNFEWN